MKRDTQQREAIRKTVLNAGRPLSIQEIFETAKKEVSGLGIATVYRNLKSLCEEGAITQINLPGHPSCWEKATESHHHHFYCLSCNRFFEIHNCPKDLKKILPDGFDLTEHYILLRGKCSTCANKPQDLHD